MKDEIKNILTYIANGAAMVAVYSDTNKDFWHHDLCKTVDKAADAIKEYINWDNLTDDECKELRFRLLDTDNPLRLIPIWLYKAIPIGTKLTSIDGEEVIFDGNNIDTDIRFGCLAYGIIPKDKQSPNNEE